ncbi:hypothetical protein TUMEXPCC7403_23695 [Tumidithrix helvetica PCC 7403]
MGTELFNKSLRQVNSSLNEWLNHRFLVALCIRGAKLFHKHSNQADLAIFKVKFGDGGISP